MVGLEVVLTEKLKSDISRCTFKIWKNKKRFLLSFFIKNFAFSAIGFENLKTKIQHSLKIQKKKTFFPFFFLNNFNKKISIYQCKLYKAYFIVTQKTPKRLGIKKRLLKPLLLSCSGCESEITTRVLDTTPHKFLVQGF